MSLSKKEAIEKLGCKQKECEHLDENGTYSFCAALLTDDMCLNKKDEDGRVLQNDDRAHKDS